MRKLIIIHIFIILLSITLFAQKLKLYFFDVGQGDGTLIITPNKKAMIIDCNTGSYYTKMINTLNNESIATLEYIIATHNHDDHYGGLDNIINNFGPNRIKTCLDHGGTYSSEWTTAALSTINGRSNITPGEWRILDSNANIKFYCVAAAGKTTTGGPYASYENAKSVGIILKYKDFDAWIAGDLTSSVEINCINDINNPSITGDGDITLYQINHHGSDTSSDATFLSALNPYITIVQSENGHGHPTQNVIDKLINVNLFNKIWLTESTNDGEIDDADPTKYPERCFYVDGDILVETDGYSVWINGELVIGSGIEVVTFFPNKLPNNGVDTSTIEVKIGIDTNSFTNVIIDWTSIGGNAYEPLYDNGTHGDRKPNDLIFTFTNLYTISNQGKYPIIITVFKTNGDKIIQTNYITVIEDTYPPVGKNFIAKFIDNKINLSWQNPSESDYDHFIIRYNTNPYSYPTSTNDGILLYSSTNKQLENYTFINFEYYKKYYFRIFFVDVKGNYSYLSKDILIVPTDEKEYVKISDNFIKPEDGQEIEIIFNNSVLNTSHLPEIKIFNIKGELLKKIDVSRSDIDFSNNSIKLKLTDRVENTIASGLYFIVINTSKGTVKHKILVVH